jgi:hypothetical protein
VQGTVVAYDMHRTVNIIRLARCVGRWDELLRSCCTGSARPLRLSSRRTVVSCAVPPSHLTKWPLPDFSLRMSEPVWAAPIKADHGPGVRALLKSGSCTVDEKWTVQGIGDRTPLSRALFHKAAAAVDVLIECGVHVDAVCYENGSDWKVTPLGCALLCDCPPAIIAALLRAGAPTTATFVDSGITYTPESYATQHNKLHLWSEALQLAGKN